MSVQINIGLQNYFHKIMDGDFMPIKKIMLITAVMAIMLLIPVTAFAGTVQTPTSAKFSYPDFIELDISGGAQPVGFYNITTNHGWTVKTDSPTGSGQVPVKITDVSIFADRIIIYLDQYFAKGQKAYITYTKPGDKDRQVRAQDDGTAMPSITSPITCTSTEEFYAPTIDFSNSYVAYDGYTVICGTSFPASALSKQLNSWGLTQYSTQTGFKVKRKAAGATTWSTLTVTMVYLDDTTVAIEVDHSKPEKLILPTDSITLSYDPPSDFYKKIRTYEGICMVKQPETAIGNNYSIIPEIDWSKSSVENDGKTVTVYVFNGEDIIGESLLTAGHGWAVKVAPVGSSTFTSKIVSSVYSEYTSFGNIKVMINLPDDSKKILSTDAVQVAYTKPIAANRVRGTGGVELPSFTGTAISNSSTLVKPALNVATSYSTGDGVHADGYTISIPTVSDSAYNLSPLSLNAASGWTVKVGTTSKLVKTVNVDTTGVTLTIANDAAKIQQSDTGITVAYTKPADASSIKGANGIYMTNIVAKEIYNGSSAAAPVVDWTYNNHAGTYANGTTVTLKAGAVKFKPSTSFITKGWSVKQGTTLKTVTGVASNCSGDLILTLSSAATADLTISYAKQTIGDYPQDVYGIPLGAITTQTAKFG